MFKKILIANRGEIAVRVNRAAHELGIETVAIFSEADRLSLHVRNADQGFCVGPGPVARSYLNIPNIISAALISGADAVHPGYGFLAENARFAEICADHGLTFIGPSPETIAKMGDKATAKSIMQAAKVPTTPGTEILASAAEALTAAKSIGYPVMLKATAGGGGKGMREVRTPAELEHAFATAQAEAEANFKDGRLYMEKLIEKPRHLEVQILGDAFGNVVHVGERDCSLQRRHQKLFEEAPARVTESVRERLRHAGIAAARAIGYDSVGTIETLVSGDEFFFLEMNTRIQVEHTISEMISGIDLIAEQIRVAAGEPLGYDQSDVQFRGHAIEVRVNAEDPAQGFRPAPGTISAYVPPAGLGVRVDSAATLGTTISPDYDSMIAKLIVWAPTRDGARARLRRAIDEYRIGGVPTTLGFLRALGDSPEVAGGDYGTATLEAFAATWKPAADAHADNGSAVASASPPAAETEVVRVEVNDKLFRVRLIDRPAGGGRPLPAGRNAPPKRSAPRAANGRVSSGNQVVSPMHGVVVELKLAPGDEVAEGQVVAVIEAMKMMNEIRAHRSGSVATVHASAGSTVEAFEPLVTLA